MSEYISSNTKVDTEDSSLLPFVNSIKTDLPTIDTALKNLASILMAQNATYSDVDLLIKEDKVLTLNPKEALDCARRFSISLKTFMLKEEAEFLSTVKVQSKDQDGLSRLDEVLQYRSLLFLFKKIKAHNEITPEKNRLNVSKLFGSKLFKWSFQFPLFKEHVLAADFSSSVASKEKVGYFLDQFSMSLDDKNSLVWKADMNTELRVRASQRQEMAKQRVVDAEARAQSSLREEILSDGGIDTEIIGEGLESESRLGLEIGREGGNKTSANEVGISTSEC